MTVFCVKKLCIYNSACCVHNSESVHTCTLEDIFINAEVECDNFKGEYNKLTECNKCLAKKGLITFELEEDNNINLTIKKAKPFNPNKFNKK